MKAILFIFSFLMLNQLSIGQSLPKEYYFLIMKADSLYEIKDYKGSAQVYSDVFNTPGWEPAPSDRYNAACSWALAGEADSAFYNLDMVANKSKFTEYKELNEDEDLISLHSDKRWEPLVEKIKIKQEKAEAKLNKQLAHILDSLYTEDQEYRMMSDKYRKEYGADSEEMKTLWKTIAAKDSSNLVVVTGIIDTYGWLGDDVVGKTGNSTIFLVIQHADLKTQEKYLPVMKEAVKNGNANAAHLALLIDRVEMRNGRPQVYGSQITTKNGKPVIYEIGDEVNVNKRRAEVGLEPLEKYVKNWDIEYKLPTK